MGKRAREADPVQGASASRSALRGWAELADHTPPAIAANAPSRAIRPRRNFRTGRACVLDGAGFAQRRFLLIV